MLNLNFHILEFKFRFCYILFSFFLTFFTSYFYAETLIYLYTLPFLHFQLLSHKVIVTNFIFTNLSEAFNSYICISTMATMYFIVLISIQNFFSYFKIGLYKYEKQALLLCIQIFIGYIHFVVILLTQIMLPIFLNFFLSFEKSIENALFTIRYEARLFDYIILVNKFIIFSFIFFSILFVFVYMFKANLLSITLLKKNRRIFVLAFFVLGALFSPPDIYSQLLIAIPLSFCFELMIFLFYVKKIYFSKFDEIFFKKRL